MILYSHIASRAVLVIWLRFFLLLLSASFMHIRQWAERKPMVKAWLPSEPNSKSITCNNNQINRMQLLIVGYTKNYIMLFAVRIYVQSQSSLAFNIGGIWTGKYKIDYNNTCKASLTRIHNVYLFTFSFIGMCYIVLSYLELNIAPINIMTNHSLQIRNQQLTTHCTFQIWYSIGDD